MGRIDVDANRNSLLCEEFPTELKGVKKNRAIPLKTPRKYRLSYQYKGGVIPPTSRFGSNFLTY